MSLQVHTSLTYLIVVFSGRLQARHSANVVLLAVLRIARIREVDVRHVRDDIDEVIRLCTEMD